MRFHNQMNLTVESNTRLLRFKDHYPIHESRPTHSAQQYQTQALAPPQDFVGTGSEAKSVIPDIDHRSNQT